MAFEEQLPQWENEGTQPPQSKRVEGWLPNEKPPASWFNWLFHRAYKALEELQQKAGEKEAVEQAQQTAANAQSDIDEYRDMMTSLGLGIGVIPRASEDLNNELDTGWVRYEIETLNRPEDFGTSGVVQVIRSRSGRVAQIAYNLAGGTTPRMTYRIKGDQAWGDWLEILTPRAGADFRGDVYVFNDTFTGGSTRKYGWKKTTGEYYAGLEMYATGLDTINGVYLGFLEDGNNVFSRARIRVRPDNDVQIKNRSDQWISLIDGPAGTYEEGTWTPTLGVLDGVDGNHTYSIQIGRYIRIGNIVVAHFNLQLSEKDLTMSGHSVLVKGLPFAARPGETNLLAPVTLGSVTDITLLSGYNQFLAYVASGRSGITLGQVGDSVPFLTIHSNSTTNTTAVSGTAVYRI